MPTGTLLSCKREVDGYGLPTMKSFKPVAQLCEGTTLNVLNISGEANQNTTFQITAPGSKRPPSGLCKPRRGPRCSRAR